MCIFSPLQVIFSKLITGPECLQWSTNFTLLPTNGSHPLYVPMKVYSVYRLLFFFFFLHESPTASQLTIAADKLIIGTSRRLRRCLTNDAQFVKTTISEQT